MIPQAYLYICDGDIDNPVLTHKKMDWPEKYPHWQEIPLVMAQPEQEPVATIAVRWHEPVGKVAFVLEVNLPVGIHKVYTTPPQRTWVGLTDEEIQYCVELKNPEAIAEEVEAKLKEKNA